MDDEYGEEGALGSPHPRELVPLEGLVGAVACAQVHHHEGNDEDHQPAESIDEGLGVLAQKRYDVLSRHC